MKTHMVAAGALLFCGLSTGCSALRPTFGPPGPIDLQQARASHFDPYTDNEAAPEVVGGRPRDFDAPTNETVRNRWYVDGVRGLQFR